MPARINVGLSRKVGESNYGSRGGSVSVELEIDSATLSDPAAFRNRVQTLYAMARGSLEEELARTDEEPSPEASPVGVTRPVVSTSSPQPPVTPRINGQSSRPLNGRYATQSQIRAIFAIGKRQQVDPRELVRQMFNVNSVDELSVREASQLIDQLNAPVGASQ
ncbi:MAG: hypothetical protein Q8M16_20305 [Pirellulaceae bacterium]|nr:hypothetical protein [Pirellulaceae bacterium]